jgi:hypothetical protein
MHRAHLRVFLENADTAAGDRGLPLSLRYGCLASDCGYLRS